MKDQIKKIIKEELKAILIKEDAHFVSWNKLNKQDKQLAMYDLGQGLSHGDMEKYSKFEWDKLPIRLQTALSQSKIEEARLKVITRPLAEAPKEKKDTSAYDAALEQHKKMSIAHNKLLSSYYAAKTPAAKKSIKAQVDASTARKKSLSTRMKAMKAALKEDKFEPDTSSTEFEEQVPEDKRLAFLKAFKNRIGLNQTDDNVRIMYKFSKNMSVNNQQMESIRHCVSAALRAVGVHVPDDQLAKADILIPIIFSWSTSHKLSVVPFTPSETPPGFVATTY